MNIAFIPVRGGSKSIPMKNVKLINGMPLVYWVTKAANDAECVDKIIIATDSEEIKEIVKIFNLPKVEIYDRDPANAQDESSTESVMLEYIEYAKLNADDNFILIQATSPLLTSGDIDLMFWKYQEYGYDSIFSAVREKQFHWIETENSVEPINYDYRNRPRRQNFRGILAENGACYINKVANIVVDKCRLSGKIGFFEMSPETSYEIDEKDDFIIVESLLKKQEEKTKRNKQNINVGFGISQNWQQYTIVTITSILENANNKDDYNFYILSDKFSEEDKQAFLKLGKIRKAKFHFIEIDNSEFDGAIHDWLGVSASYRLKLPSVVSEDKILYLDSDIIAKQDITELYSTDISDYYLAAVEDKCTHFMYTRVGLEKGETFFNSGVQLLNLKAYRENNIEEKMFKALRESTYYTDQDVMNDVCRGHILSLPLKYNIVLPIDHLEATYLERKSEAYFAAKQPCLIHYRSKPWKGARNEINSHWFNCKEKYDNL